MKSRNATRFGTVILLILGCALVYTGFRMRRTSGGQVCDACTRPLHHHSQVVGLVGGDREIFCCLACALSTQRQTGTPVKVVKLTDYETDSRLLPEGAYLAVGTNVNLCTQHHAMLDESKHSYPVGFDRCSPSILAFARKQSAERFVQEHGGQLERYADFAASYRP